MGLAGELARNSEFLPVLSDRHWNDTSGLEPVWKKMHLSVPVGCKSSVYILLQGQR